MNTPTIIEAIQKAVDDQVAGQVAMRLDMTAADLLRRTGIKLTKRQLEQARERFTQDAATKITDQVLTNVMNGVL